jgi:hypothetical protein
LVALFTATTAPVLKRTPHALLVSVEMLVADQYANEVSRKNGWPLGRDGSVSPGSTRLANSWIVGSRQPFRFPTVFVLQWLWAVAQSCPPVSGAFSQTSPVSLSPDG